MDLDGAVLSHPRGCILRFEVVPGSSRLAVPSGFNVWRRSLEARLTEKPSRGRANLQLIEELSRVFCILKSDIEVVSGQKTARKTVLVRGLAADRAISILASKIK